jgi:heptosyltransferase-2/heptosyltransferase-3
MVLLTPVIRALSARYASPVDVVSMGAETSALLKGQQAVGDLCLVSRRQSPYWLSYTQRKLVRRLAARAVGPVWDCDATGKSASLLARAGIRDEMVALGSDYPRRDGEHHLDRWLRFVRATPAGCPEGDLAAMDAESPHASIDVAQPWRDDLDQWFLERGIAGRPLLLLHASRRRMPRRGRIVRGGGRPEAADRNWPAERWAKVVEMLRAREPGAMIVLTGSMIDREFNESILAASGHQQAVNAANDLPIRRLLALQERALGMISVDADSAWTAAAVGCPVLVLYGANDPKVHAPRGRLNAVETLSGRHEGVRSMLGIEIKEVQEAWDRLRQSCSEAGRPEGKQGSGLR